VPCDAEPPIPAFDPELDAACLGAPLLTTSEIAGLPNLALRPLGRWLAAGRRYVRCDEYCRAGCAWVGLTETGGLVSVAGRVAASQSRPIALAKASWSSADGARCRLGHRAIWASGLTRKIPPSSIPGRAGRLRPSLRSHVVVADDEVTEGCDHLGATVLDCELGAVGAACVPVGRKGKAKHRQRAPRDFEVGALSVRFRGAASSSEMVGYASRRDGVAVVGR
jgi:hypothetical protein